MGESYIQRQVKRLTKQEQKSILWDLALEFRAIIALHRAAAFVQERANVCQRAKTLEEMLQNMLIYAQQGFQESTFACLAKLLALVSDFIRVNEPIPSERNNKLSKLNKYHQ